MDDKRPSMFTVRDAENAMLTFSIFAMGVIFGIFFHELLIAHSSIVNALYAIAGNVSNILSAATLLTLLEEGSDIMFQRIRDTLRKERQLVAETKDEVYKEVADWNQRRLEAESRGEVFNEPVPGSDRPTRKKRKFLFFSAIAF